MNIYPVSWVPADRRAQKVNPTASVDGCRDYPWKNISECCGQWLYTGVMLWSEVVHWKFTSSVIKHVGKSQMNMKKKVTESRRKHHMRRRYWQLLQIVAAACSKIKVNPTAGEFPVYHHWPQHYSSVQSVSTAVETIREKILASPTNSLWFGRRNEYPSSELSACGSEGTSRRSWKT